MSKLSDAAEGSTAPVAAGPDVEGKEETRCFFFFFFFFSFLIP
jgi:hypothetical protein